MGDAAASILIVDDTVENLRLLATMLGAGGYEARPVRSGAEAIQAAQRATPDLILLDITMPELDGYETCTRLKATPGLEDVPILFITALGSLADKVRAFDVGGADYITKPFQIEEVMARVRVHLELRRSRVALALNYERLRKLEQLRDDLTSMLVHDMRSPLTVILARLEFLRDAAGGRLAADSLDDVEAAARAARVVSGMANDLLDVSRMSEGKFPLDRRATDLATVAAAVRASVSGWQPNRVIDVESTGFTVIACDHDVIRRVIENLLTNAIKHSPEHGRIRIVVTGGSSVRVEVHDQGPGVPVEARERIFEKFGTVETRQRGAYHSAGLGLAFCKLAVEAHGGHIGVIVAGGGGSQFWFELPVDAGARR